MAPNVPFNLVAILKGPSAADESRCPVGSLVHAPNVFRIIPRKSPVGYAAWAWVAPRDARVERSGSARGMVVKDQEACHTGRKRCLVENETA